MKNNNLTDAKTVNVKKNKGDENITKHKDNTPKISVIVPIYNVEKYLAQCLDSIINQTQKNIEIVCVNDGSTDGSLEILKQYQAKDKRIIIINQKNLGLSAARNAGIQRSNGDFIVFIDSDDYIAEDMIEKMYQAIIYKNSDVVSCGAECFNDNGIITEALNKKQQWCNRYLYSGYRMVGTNIRQEFCPMACCKMYRTDIIRKYQIQFPQGLINEDEYWLWAYMIHCSVTFGIAEKLYFYRQRTDSIMGQRQSNIKILDIIDIHKKIYEVVNQYKNIEVYRNTLSDLFIMHMRDLYKRLPIMYYDQFVHKISVYAEQYINSEKINEFQRFIKTKISVIVPIYNAIAYVRQCLDSLKRQTLHNLEIICVDDGSTDGSLNILKQYAAQDDRFIILSQKNSGSAAARNYGLQKATGDYIGFMDSDDYVSDNYFEKLLECALKNEAEIAATSSVKLFNAYGNKSSKDMGFQGKKIITSVEDKGNIIITTGVSWNKIYLKDFIERNNIKCLELKNAAEDNYFTDTSIMTANKIAVIDDVTYFYRINSNSQTKVLKDKSQFSMTEVYKKIDTFVKNQSYMPEIEEQWFSIINKRKILDYFYFRNTMQPEIIADFRKHFLHEFPYLEKDLPEIIVSLTSYPARIGTVNKTIESLLYQSYKADKIILYLGADKFPKKDKDLPKQLLALRSHLFEIHWVDKDLRSFTKLIPALQEYPDAALVTVDDDILYPSEWLERLVTSFINNSDIIHAHRVHKILFKQKKIIPYKDWQFCISDNSISFNNFLTGVGGVLYPPHCLHKDIFDEEKFMRLCPQADDIWFWAMAVKNNVPTKVVKNNYTKHLCIEGTQEDCLWKSNLNLGKNDIQLQNVLKEYPEILDKLDKLIYKQNLKLPNKSITYYKLFNFITFFIYKKRGGNQVWKIFGLPIWRIRKIAVNNIIKYYLLGLPICLIEQK